MAEIKGMYMVELVGIELSTRSENRQVIDLSRILQCPESLERLQCRIHCTVIVRRFSVKANRLSLLSPILGPGVQKLAPTSH